MGKCSLDNWEKNKYNHVAIAQNLQTIKTFLSLELSLYGKSGSTFS